MDENLWQAYVHVDFGARNDRFICDGGKNGNKKIILKTVVIVISFE
jgi:hypothetical protein